LYFFEVILREEILNSERSLKSKFLKKNNNVQQLLKFGIIFDFICSIIVPGLLIKKREIEYFNHAINKDASIITTTTKLTNCTGDRCIHILRFKINKLIGHFCCCCCSKESNFFLIKS
jgi:hypothetical protein